MGSPGVSNTVRAKRPLYGPHPTQSTNHTHAREYVVARGSRHGQPNRVTPDDGRLHCPCSRLGGHSDRETPGPIPNPEAKPDSADGTAPARVRESRTPPSTHHTFGPRGAPQRSTPGAEPVAALKTTPPRRNPSRGPARSSLHQEPPPTSPTRWHTSASETERCPDRTDSGIRNGAPLSL